MGETHISIDEIAGKAEATKEPYWNGIFSDIAFNKLTLPEVLYWNGAMLYLRACVGSGRWRELIWSPDWQADLSKALAEDWCLKEYLEKWKQEEAREDRLTKYFEKLRAACFNPEGADLNAAVMYLGELGAQAAERVAASEVAYSKAAQSRRLTEKRVKAAKDRARKLRKIWMTGKYKARDTCADEEWEALGFPSFRAARDSLTGTPAPNKPAVTR